MIVSPWFLFWIGVFAECEIMMERLMDLRVERILHPSPLALYLQEPT